MHSSLTELQNFVKLLQPETIFPIVYKVNPDAYDPTRWLIGEILQHFPLVSRSRRISSGGGGGGVGDGSTISATPTSRHQQRQQQREHEHGQLTFHSPRSTKKNLRTVYVALFGSQTSGPAGMMSDDSQGVDPPPVSSHLLGSPSAAGMPGMGIIRRSQNDYEYNSDGDSSGDDENNDENNIDIHGNTANLENKDDDYANDYDANSDRKVSRQRIRELMQRMVAGGSLRPLACTRPWFCKGTTPSFQ